VHLILISIYGCLSTFEREPAITRNGNLIVGWPLEGSFHISPGLSPESF